MAGIQTVCLLWRLGPVTGAQRGTLAAGLTLFLSFHEGNTEMASLVPGHIQQTHTQHAGQLVLLSVPDAYSIVSPGLFRSGSLAPPHFPFVRSLGLKSVLLLSPEPPSRLLLGFFEDAGITVRHLHSYASGTSSSSGLAGGNGLALTTGNGATNAGPTSAGGGYSALPGELLKAGLEWALTSKPTLILDAGGIAETGMAVAILRRQQGWSLGSALAEYRSFAGQKAKYWHEAVIEAYDLDLLSNARSSHQT